MKFGRYTLLVIPAAIFLVVSMRFFIMGMSVNDTTGEMFAIAIGLSVANTIIQVVGNGFSKEELGPIIYWGWIMSYVLGVSSNFYALTLILNIPMKYVEYAIAFSLGSMIEFMPEKMIVMAWRSTFPRGIMGAIQGLRYGNRSNQNRSHNHNNNAHNNQAVQSTQSSQSTQTKGPRFVMTEDGRKIEVPPRKAGQPRAEYREYLRQYFRDKGVEVEFEQKEN